MGCDIHATLEKRVGDKWVMVRRLSESNDFYGGHFGVRHYRRFAALAGVRGAGPAPKGLPDDVSDSTALFAERWGEDGHSHSWDMVDEELLMRLKAACAPGEAWPSYPKDHFFGLDDFFDDGEHRIVYWFNN